MANLLREEIKINRIYNLLALIMILVVWCQQVCHVTNPEFEESRYQTGSDEHELYILATKDSQA